MDKSYKKNKRVHPNKHVGWKVSAIDAHNDMNYMHGLKSLSNMQKVHTYLKEILHSQGISSNDTIVENLKI